MNRVIAQQQQAEASSSASLADNANFKNGISDNSNKIISPSKELSMVSGPPDRYGKTTPTSSALSTDSKRTIFDQGPVVKIR